MHGGRALLNLDGWETTAALVAEIEDTSGWHKGHNRDGREITRSDHAEPQICLQFANCDRSIAYKLAVDSEEAWENADYKLTTMIELLTALRRGVKIEHKRMMRRLKLADID